MTSNKKLMWILIISLAINLFALGLGAGMFLQKPFHQRPPFRELSAQEFQRFPESIRKQNREQFKQQRDKIRENHRVIHELRKQLVEEISKEQLNEAKVKDLLNQIQQQQIKTLEMSQQSFISTIVKMPYPMRKEYAEHLLHQRRHR